MFHFLILILLSTTHLSFADLSGRKLDMETILSWTYGKFFNIYMLVGDFVKKQPNYKHPRGHFSELSVTSDMAYDIEKCVQKGMSLSKHFEGGTNVDEILSLSVKCLFAIRTKERVLWIYTEGKSENILADPKYQNYRLDARKGRIIIDTMTNVRKYNEDSILKVILHNKLDSTSNVTVTYNQRGIEINKQFVSKNSIFNLATYFGKDLYKIDKIKHNTLFEYSKTYTLDPESLSEISVRMNRITETEFIYQEIILSGYVGFYLWLPQPVKLWFIPISEFAKLLPNDFKLRKDDPNSVNIYMRKVREKIKYESSSVIRVVNSLDNSTALFLEEVFGNATFIDQ